ncbi:hypothetical protein [Clostridium beijerinckii]|nr:hypothetical protein [Clostridium beijerinckii]NRT34618.1 hypothetical protein [Clostridium beijerinckii]NRZ20046.1 hypothetical protein [Clostridium beijerinckii]NSA97049.1 hypothetical protein [Clostridium beijerinckii]UYZ37229.1 hypothetical protein OD350_06080 [Clostridium beijerinckii]CUU47605.1 protein of unknown function [Clostridium beijerinckii]
MAISYRIKVNVLVNKNVKTKCVCKSNLSIKNYDCKGVNKNEKNDYF